MGAKLTERAAILSCVALSAFTFAGAVTSNQHDGMDAQLIAELRSEDNRRILSALEDVRERTVYQAELVAPVTALLQDESERVRHAAAECLFALARLSGCFGQDASDACPLMNQVYDKLPTATSVVNPSYPREGRRQELEADVRLEVLVDARGRVVVAEPLDPVPDFFASASVKAVKKWRFEPAEIDGSAVPIVGLLSTTFRLH